VGTVPGKLSAFHLSNPETIIKRARPIRPSSNPPPPLPPPPFSYVAFDFKRRCSVGRPALVSVPRDIVYRYAVVVPSRMFYRSPTFATIIRFSEKNFFFIRFSEFTVVSVRKLEKWLAIACSYCIYYIYIYICKNARLSFLGKISKCPGAIFVLRPDLPISDSETLSPPRPLRAYITAIIGG